MGEAWEKMKEFAASPAGQFLLKMAKWAGIAVAAIIAFPFAVIVGFALMVAYIISKWNLIVAFLKKTAIFTGKLILAYLFPLVGIYLFRKEIGKVFDWIWDKVKDFPIVQKLVEQFTGLKDRIASVFSGMWESLKSIFQGVLPIETMNDLIDGLNWISRKLNDFSSSKAVSALGISPLNLPIIPHIEQRALGGPINAGQPYIVGERGPELVVPRDNGNVIPNDKLASAGNSGIGGGNTFSFSISINSASPDYDAYSLVEKVMELLNGENGKSKQRYELGLQ